MLSSQGASPTRRLCGPYRAALLNFCTQYQLGVVSYCIQAYEAGDSWNKIILVFNGKNAPVSIPLPEGTFKMVAYNGQIDENGIGMPVSEQASVEAISMSMFVSFQSRVESR